jgi:arginine-tRNA-protein transferase
MACNACWRIRAKAREYDPNRSQLRAQRANQETRLVIGKPILDDARVDLYRRHHLARQEQKGWKPSAGNGQDYIRKVASSPVPILEFAFYRDDKLVAVSYITDLAHALFGSYYFYDPDYKHLSLGTWMVMSLIFEAAARGFEYAYLGTFVAGCGSLEYKSAFSPNQVRKPLGEWEDFK